ncbi:MAG: radical SAM family heme chaperone HemW [Anaerolineaceae bacterium]
MKPFSLYLHIPFCEQRCSYCDFNTYAGVLNRIPRYMHALRQEIHRLAGAHSVAIPVHTVYLGGGTPSLIPADQLDSLLALIGERYLLQSEAEITLEANPGTLTPEYLRRIRRVGFNRLSIGMQSANDRELKMLGRIHRAEDVHQSINWAREAGFENLSLDLIYGLPGQTLTDWQTNLQAALQTQPEHLSLYALTLEPHVPMARRIRSGGLLAQDDDLEADMYELATEMLEKAGFLQYEISNWARADRARDLRSRHNLQYWLNQPYLGFGAGAHGCAHGVRTENVSRILAYIERCLTDQVVEFPCGPAIKTATRINRRREMQETMMLGLRLLQGVTEKRFQARFKAGLKDVFGKEISELLALGLLEEMTAPEAGVRLSHRGRFLSNIVFRQFVD